MRKMNAEEKTVFRFANDFLDRMGWHNIPIARVKISRMERYKGLCVSDGESIYLNISETANVDNKDFFATVIHELIHARLLTRDKTWAVAHKHGKHFRKLAKKVKKVSGGFYSVKEIV